MFAWIFSGFLLFSFAHLESKMASADGRQCAVSSVPLSNLAKRIARPRRTGNPQVDNKSDTAYQHLLEGVNLLVHYESMRGDLVAGMRRTVTAQSMAEDSTTEWGSVTNVANLDHAWMATRIVHKCPGIIITTLTRAKVYDKAPVLHIFCWLHYVSPNCAIPPECRVKTGLEKVLDERLKNSGNRQRLVPADFLLPNGAVNWVPLLYLVGFSAAEVQRLSSITHTPTGAQVVIDEHIGIDSSFELVHGWSDGNAELQKGVTRKFKLCTFFSNNIWPLQFSSVDRRVQELSDTCSSSCRGREGKDGNHRISNLRGIRGIQRSG